MTVLYRDSELAKMFGTLKLQALESPVILAGIESAQSHVPELGALSADIARSARELLDSAVEKTRTRGV